MSRRKRHAATAGDLFGRIPPEPAQPPPCCRCGNPNAGLGIRPPAPEPHGVFCRACVPPSYWPARRDLQSPNR
jgi:hypothetical protein